MSKETKVGIFVVIVLLMLFGLSSQVGSFKFGSKSGYPISVEIKDANGIEVNAKVKSRGIDIGYIDSFTLTASSVKVNLFINQNIKIPKDSIVSLKQESMLGVNILK